MGVDQFLNVTYKLSSSDNLDGYLEAMGVAKEIREKAGSPTTTMTLIKNGDVYSIKTTSPFRDHAYNFTPGVECDNLGLDGISHRCILNIVGNKIINEILSNPSTITSEYYEDKVVVTLQKGDLEATQVYERV